MKVYRGIVKGNTILLEEKPDLPDECPALVEIKPVGQPVANCDRFTKTPRSGFLPYAFTEHGAQPMQVWDDPGIYGGRQ